MYGLLWILFLAHIISSDLTGVVCAQESKIDPNPDRQGVLVGVSRSGIQYVEIGTVISLANEELPHRANPTSKNQDFKKYFEATNTDDGGCRGVPLEDRELIFRNIPLNYNHMIRVRKGEVDLIDDLNVSLGSLGEYQDWIPMNAKPGDILDPKITAIVAEKIAMFYKGFAGERRKVNGFSGHPSIIFCYLEEFVESSIVPMNSRLLIHRREFSEQEIAVVVEKDNVGITLELATEVVTGALWGDSKKTPLKIQEMQKAGVKLKFFKLNDDENVLYIAGSFFDTNVKLRVSDARVFLTRQEVTKSADGLKLVYGEPVTVREAKFPEFSKSVLDRVEIGTTIKKLATTRRLHDFLLEEGEFAPSK